MIFTSLKIMIVVTNHCHFKNSYICSLKLRNWEKIMLILSLKKGNWCTKNWRTKRDFLCKKILCQRNILGMGKNQKYENNMVKPEFEKYILHSLTKNWVDFEEEQSSIEVQLSKLTENGNLDIPLLTPSPKCHCELAGEIVKYCWRQVKRFCWGFGI